MAEHHLKRKQDDLYDSLQPEHSEEVNNALNARGSDGYPTKAPRIGAGQDHHSNTKPSPITTVDIRKSQEESNTAATSGLSRNFPEGIPQDRVKMARQIREASYEYLDAKARLSKYLAAMDKTRATASTSSLQQNPESSNYPKEQHHHEDSDDENYNNAVKQANVTLATGRRKKQSRAALNKLTSLTQQECEQDFNYLKDVLYEEKIRRVLPYIRYFPEPLKQPRKEQQQQSSSA